MSMFHSQPYFGMSPPPMGMVPGYSGPMWPTGNGFTAKPNNMNGFDFAYNNPALQPGGAAAAPKITPWMPPTGNGSGSRWNAPRTPNDGLIHAFSEGSPAGTPAGTPGVVGGQSPAAGRAGMWNGFMGTPPPQPAAPAGGSSNWLQNILNQAGSQQWQNVSAPDVGIKDPAMQNLMNYQNWMFNQANNQNQNRFNLAVGALQGQGQSSISDANQYAQNSKGQVAQDMISRGLNNSTIGDDLKMGIDREKNRQIQRVNEGTADRLVSLLGSKTDQAPNPVNFADLMQKAAFNPGVAGFAGGVGSFMGGGGGGVTYGGSPFGSFSGGSAGMPFGGSTPASNYYGGSSSYWPWM